MMLYIVCSEVCFGEHATTVLHVWKKVTLAPTGIAHQSAHAKGCISL